MIKWLKGYSEIFTYIREISNQSWDTNRETPCSRCDSGVERWRDCLPPSFSRSGGMERSGTHFLEWIDKRSFYKSALYPMSPDMVGCAGSAQAGIHQSHPPRASQGRRRRRQVTSVTKGSSFTSPRRRCQPRPIDHAKSLSLELEHKHCLARQNGKVFSTSLAQTVAPIIISDCNHCKKSLAKI